jgi:hypothetical protein
MCVYLNKKLFIIFHDDAYFPLCGEVLLYFIVRVEVVTTQIYKKDLKKKKDFLFS